MKIFEFKLQSVLDIAVAEIERIEIKLKNLKDNISLVQNEIEQINREILKTQTRETSINFGVNRFILMKEYLNGLFEKKREKQRKIKSLIENEEKVTAKAVILMNKIKTLEKIKKEKRLEYFKNVSNKEQEILEDLIMSKKFFDNLKMMEV